MRQSDPLTQFKDGLFAFNFPLVNSFWGREITYPTWGWVVGDPTTPVIDAPQ